MKVTHVMKLILLFCAGLISVPFYDWLGVLHVLCVAVKVHVFML